MLPSWGSRSAALQLESRRPLACHVELSLQTHAHPRNRAFVKQPPNQRDAVRNSARRREFRKWTARIRCPVCAGLRNFHKTCSQSQRRMPGEICDGKHFIAQRRHQQQINLRKDTCHFFGNFAAKPIGLHKIDGGQKPGLPKQIWPRVVGLNFQLIDAMGKRQLFKCGCTLRKDCLLYTSPSPRD